MLTEPGWISVDLAFERERRKGRKPGKIPICSDGNNRRKGTYSKLYVPFIVCAFGLLLGCEHIVSVQCLFNQFWFRASCKRAEQVEPVKCAFADRDADSDSFFFFLVHNGIFLCAFGLLFWIYVVPLCRHDCEIMWIWTSVLIPITQVKNVWFFLLGAFRSQFFFDCADKYCYHNLIL